MEIIVVFFLAIITSLVIKSFKNTFSKSYFSLSQVISASAEDITFKGFILLLTPVFIGSIFIYFFGFDLNYIVLYGFFSAFLLIWPSILFPEELLDYDIYIKRNKLYLLFLFYTIFLCFITIIAYYLMTIIFEKNTPLIKFFDDILGSYINLHPLYQNIIGGLIATIIFSIFILLIRRLNFNIRTNKRNVG